MRREVPWWCKALIIAMMAAIFPAIQLSNWHINQRSAASTAAVLMPDATPTKPLTVAQQKCADSIKFAAKPTKKLRSIVTVSGGPGCVKKGTRLHAFSSDSYNHSLVEVTDYQRRTNGSFSLKTAPITPEGVARTCGLIIVRLTISSTEPSFKNDLTFGGERFPAGMQAFAPLPSIRTPDPYYDDKSDC